MLNAEVKVKGMKEEVRRPAARTIVLILLLAVAGCKREPPALSDAVPADHQAQVQAWREKHEADYRRDFVTVSGLYFVDAGVYTVGKASTNGVVIDAPVPDVIGTLQVENGRVQLRSAGHQDVREPLRSDQSL